MSAGRADTVGDDIAENVGLHLGAVRAEFDRQGAGVGACRLAEAYDPRFVLQRVAPQPLVMWIVAIEDGGAAGHQAFEDLGLGIGDRFHRAEEAEMDRRDRGDDGDLWPDQLGQGPQLARVIHAGFEHAEARVLAHIGEGERHPPMVVVRLERDVDRA